MKVRFYVNSIGSWASTVTPIITTSVTVGSRIFYPLEQEIVEKVIALGKPLYIVFAGSFLNDKIVENLGQIQLTTSIVNQQSFIARSRFISRADHAETATFANEAGSATHAKEAESAEEAGYAGSAGSAVVADNFFMVSADEL